MPTDNSVQTALTAPPANSTQPVFTDELIKTVDEKLIKSHPYVQTLEKRYAAAHQEIDGKKTKKELESEIARLKVLAGEAPTTIPTQITTPQTYDAAKMQEEIEWNITNKQSIQTAGQAYHDLRSKGYEKQDALDLALARKPNTDNAEQLRVQQTAGGSGSMDRTSTNIPTVPGVSKEYLASMKLKFPDLSQERLIEMVQHSVARSQSRGA